VDPGEKVLFGVPQWNNDYYCDLVGAKAVTLECDARTGFLPTAEMLRPHVRDARLLALNSPLNPTGTAFDAAQLSAICDLVLEENARRAGKDRPLFVLYDQVYWMITNGIKHVHPVGLRPEIAPYAIYVDAISKAFASTGLRVGWAIGPVDVIRPMNDVIGHVGAWAPRAEQVATAKFLSDAAAVDRYIDNMRTEATRRLDVVHDGLCAMQSDGLPVESIRPQGAIYVSARFALHGSRTSSGEVLATDEDVRRFLLRDAGLAVVPFSAFGAHGDHGWFRISIGVASVADIISLMPRLREAIGSLVGKEVAAD
jgi:aspartate aminotransferase